MNSIHNSISTIEHLPQEVFYMIMDLLVYSERLECRLINKHFMRMASYIFKTVQFSSRERVRFFAEALVKTPCIAGHVQVILVDNAAVLRAVNHTNIKEACFNVREINITRTQGRGSWAQHLIPYPHLQHPPALMDDVNSKIILDNFSQQIMTFRLGGTYLKALTTVENISTLIKRVPNIRTFGLHFLYKDKCRNIHFDLPRSFTFAELNTILKQPTLMSKFELQYCEIADFSLITRTFNPSQAIIDHVRQFDNSPKTTSLFDPLQNLRHIEMKQVKVTNVTWFIQSILKSFPNLESLNVEFVPRNIILENATGGKWDTPHPDDWSFELPASRLKKIALSTTQGRLAIPETLLTLGEAQAPLEDIRIINSGHCDWEAMTVVRDLFCNTLKHLTIDSKEDFGVERLKYLNVIKTADLTWKHNDADVPFCPAMLLQSSPQMTNLRIGYNTNCGRIRTYYNHDNFVPLTNITSLSLGRVILSRCEMKKLFLPLVNIKEALFEYCVFDHQGERETELLLNAEMYDHLSVEDTQKLSNLFSGVKREERLQQYGTVEDANEVEDATRGSTISTIPWILKREMINIPSLSLEHLGIHDCRLRDLRGGISAAKTIRNFEVNQDLRSGCSKTYDIDRAYHEKKNCNPHVVVNQKKVTEHRIGFHFTHEFGGTTGRNRYQVTRPTMVINCFSLEKLSIRPHALMSIYFTGENGERLKTCKNFIKEAMQSPDNIPPPEPTTQFPISQSSSPIKEIGQLLNQVTIPTPDQPTGQITIPAPSLLLGRALDEVPSLLLGRPPNLSPSIELPTDQSEPSFSFQDIIANTNIEGEPEITSIKSDEEVKQIEDLLAQVIRAENDSSEGISLKEELFGSDLFKAKIHSFKSKGVEHEHESASETPRKKNKKTMQIRPF